jgi:hypothetical protein
MATLAPSLASRFAIAAPMPREPPVTSATFSVNCQHMISYAFCRTIQHFADLIAWYVDVPSLPTDLAQWGILAIPYRNA